MGKHTLRDVPRSVLDEALAGARRGEPPTDRVAPIEPLNPRPYVESTPSGWFRQQEEPTVETPPATRKPPPADPEGEDSQYLDDMAHDNDERWEDLDEELGQESKPNWRLFIVISLHLLVFIPSLLYAGILMGSSSEPEPKVETVTQEVTKEVLPQACLTALSEANRAYDLTIQYNNGELQPLPTTANGMHFFTPEHGMDHYAPLRQFDKDLKASHEAFMNAAKACK